MYACLCTLGGRGGGERGYVDEWEGGGGVWAVVDACVGGGSKWRMGLATRSMPYSVYSAHVLFVSLLLFLSIFLCFQ